MERKKERAGKEVLLRREILKPPFCIVQGSFIVDGGGGGDNVQERNLRNETRGEGVARVRTVGSGNHEHTRPYPLFARVEITACSCPVTAIHYPG